VELVRIFLDGRLWRGPGPLCALLLVLANFYVARTERKLQEERQASLLALKPTSAGSDEPRYDWSVGEDPERYWRSIPDARLQPLVIVSGMSQMYAINDAKPGDEIIAEHLDDVLRPLGARAFGLAAPNMDNEEALVYLLATTLDPRTKPAAFVYGVCFDKFRNVDLRPGLTRFLERQPGLRDAWLGLCSSRSAQYPMACAKVRAAASDGKRTESREDDTEYRLRSALGRAVPIVADSTDLNGQAQYELYLLRNYVFRIKSTTKRPMLDSVYSLNQEFLGLMADVAKERSVQLVLYVIPLNPGADNPYVPEQYASFKAWLERFASVRSLPFANLEAAVPHDDWGLTNEEPDFKHFREHGHELTAAALLKAFGAVLPPGRVAP
jgi:hypothetical protein